MEGDIGVATLPAPNGAVAREPGPPVPDSPTQAPATPDPSARSDVQPSEESAPSEPSVPKVEDFIASVKGKWGREEWQKLHDAAKDDPTYNPAFQSSLQRAINDHREQLERQQAVQREASYMADRIARTLPADQIAHEKAGTYFDPLGNIVQQGTKGARTLLGWKMHISDVQARLGQGRGDPIMELTTNLLSEFQQVDEFKGIDFMDLLEKAGKKYPEARQRMPGWVRMIVDEAVKSERSAIEDRVQAEVAKVLAARNISVEEIGKVPGGGREVKGSPYRTLDQLNAAHAQGLLDTVGDPYGNAAYRELKAAFGP